MDFNQLYDVERLRLLFVKSAKYILICFHRQPSLPPKRLFLRGGKARLPCYDIQ